MYAIANTISAFGSNIFMTHSVNASSEALIPMLNRRTFSRTLSGALLGTGGLAASRLTLHVGHTGLTWLPLGGGRPTPGTAPAINPMTDPQYVEAAIRDVASLGFAGIELFGNQIEAMEEHGGIGSAAQEIQAAADLRVLRREPLRPCAAKGHDHQDASMGGPDQKI